MKRLLLFVFALAVILPAPAAAFEVTGRFLYEDRIWDGNGFTGTVQNLPIRRARVDIVDQVTTLTLATGFTDGNGAYAIDVTGQVLPVSFYARCVTDGGSVYYITVVDAPQRDFMGGWVPPNAPLHAIITDPELLHDPGSDHDFGDYLIQDADGTGVAQAFNIFDNAVDFFDWMAQPGILGRLPNASEYVSFSWGPANPNEGSNYTQQTILLSSPGLGNDTDGWSDTVILHEQGHWFDDVFSRSDNPGGAHFIGDNDANVLLAYGEGAATYHCAKVREFRALTRGVDDLVSLYGDLTIPPPVGTPGGLSFSYDFETGLFGDTGTPIGQIGSANETNVTSALWDLLDGPITPDFSPGVDDDFVEVDDSYAWAIEHTYLPGLPSGNPVTVEDYWQGWFALNGVGFMQAGLEHIFVTLARMPFAADGLEPDDAIASAGSVAPLLHAVSPGGKVVINELHLGPLDAVELYNGSDTAVDITGWQIEVYANSVTVGAPPTVYTFLPHTIQPGETVTLHEGGLPINNGTYHVYAGDQQTFNAPWNNGIDGAVVLRDASATPIDFVKWRGVDGLGNSYDNNEPVPAGLAFTGTLDTPPAPENLARDIHGTDMDDASDFSGHYGSLGSANHPSPQYHTLFDVGDADVIGFTAVAGTRYGFETKGPYSKSDPRIELLTGTGAVIGSNDNVEGTVRDARLDYYASTSGTFYVRVTHVGTQTDYAEYHLLAFVRPLATALAPPSGLTAEAENTTNTGDAVHLQWVNAGLYDEVRVYREGTQIATLPGSESTYDDAADRGLYRYEVTGVVGGTETGSAADYEFAGVVACEAIDGFETGNSALWITPESQAGSQWAVVPGFAADGTFSFSDSPPGVPYRGSPAGGEVNAIAEFGVPADLEGGSMLLFDHICITEADFDYGIVEVSSNDGLTWTEVARYDQTDYVGWGDNVADPTDWQPAMVDLSAWDGERLRLRFRLQSDQLIELDGWYVDNVRLSGCAPTATLVAAFRAQSEASGVRLTVELNEDTPGRVAAVYRAASPDGHRSLIAQTFAAESRRVEYLDATLEIGGSAWYWVELWDPDGTQITAGPIAAQRVAPVAVTFAAAPAPNPAVREAVFAYAIGSDVAGGGPVDVRLTIYDLGGRVVRSFTPGAQGIGEYRFVWDGSRTQGGRVHPGVYYAVFSAGNYRHTSRIAMIR